MLKTVPNFDWIGEENAFAVLARATALAAQGRDIINLGIGQPDFRTPDHIVEECWLTVWRTAFSWRCPSSA